MKALVINCSSDYNLGCEKLANWLKQSGHDITNAGKDITNFDHYNNIYLSAIYTWDIPAMTKLVQQIPAGTKVEIGGPAASVMADYILLKTGIKPKIGLDARFDIESGKYLLTYTSRGCIRNCEFCSVPLVEGKIKEIHDFIPAPIVLDPNFLACSKEHIINSCEKLSALPTVDFLHGLDARLLEPWHIELFINKLNLVCWRFTFDSLKNKSTLKNVLAMLMNYGIKPEEKIIIYCIYGFSDTPEDAWERVNLITSLKAHPYAMRYQPLDTLEKDSYIYKNWTSIKLAEFKQLCNIPTMRWLNNLLRGAKKIIVR
jgi:hypothetical protein